MNKLLLKPYVHKVDGKERISFFNMNTGKLYIVKKDMPLGEIEKKMINAGLVFFSSGVVPMKISVNIDSIVKSMKLIELQIRLGGSVENSCWERKKSDIKRRMKEDLFDRVIKEINTIDVNSIRIECGYEDELFVELLRRISINDIEINVYNANLKKNKINYSSSLKIKIMKGVNLKKKEWLSLCGYKYAFNKVYNSCWGKKLSIDSNGDIKPCLWSNIVLGNIMNNKLSDVIVSKKLQSVWQITKDLIEPCNECELRYYCGDCRVFNSRQTNSNKHQIKCIKELIVIK